MKIKLSFLTTSWKEVCDGDLMFQVAFIDDNDKLLKVEKFRTVVFRTPHLAEYIVLNSIIQVEYDYMTNKTNARILK